MVLDDYEVSDVNGSAGWLGVEVLEESGGLEFECWLKKARYQEKEDL